MNTELQPLTHCPHCHAALIAPTPEIQIDLLRRFQLSRGDYYQWTDRQLERLRERLANDPGTVILLPCLPIA